MFIVSRKCKGEKNARPIIWCAFSTIRNGKQHSIMSCMANKLCCAPFIMAHDNEALSCVSDSTRRKN